MNIYNENSVEKLERDGLAICDLIPTRNSQDFCGKLVKSGNVTAFERYLYRVISRLESPLKYTHSSFDCKVSKKLAGLYNCNLNTSQKSAVKKSLSGNCLTLIHGPPGENLWIKND
ncbi:hypothetical protein AYI68_g4656 [Smittium mucronatum]|uniref:Uncharacterized protein n=1 Tax=Smittium mucronatum TaxID=133383 RepID=A0A1R0GWI0_9FUNG|nr:hypothetical protein AYI68_g4656 [Smittium mucronatum]